MRVTNNMILRNSSYNIAGTKTSVDTTMNQMTTQNKIVRPSDDPVVAIRSLRIQTNIDETNQYYNKNIPDAQSWIDVTETALINMKDVMSDVRYQAVYGATDTLNQDDRNTILKQLKSLKSQLYAEGNADYAGRTVFTGYRTDKELVFSSNESTTSYEIEEKFSFDKMEQFRYYNGEMTLPSTVAGVQAGPTEDMVQTDYYRFRASYNEVASLDIPNTSITYVDNLGVTQTIAATFTEYDTEEDWAAASTPSSKEVAAGNVVFIKSTGDFVMAGDIADAIRTNRATLTSNYTKTGFDKGELRPEYYFNCKDVTDPANVVEYSKYDADGKEIGYDINYTIASNQELTVNIEASDAFDSSIQRDIDDMIAAVTKSISAHDKLDQISKMKKEAQYQTSELQAKLDEWKQAAQKEADYADDHLQKLFSAEIGKADKYLDNINLAISQVGCSADQLELTKTRVSAQQQTLTKLQSDNDKLDISQIIINHTAMYNAYQSSLQAAGKLSGQTLLNYI